MPPRLSLLLAVLAVWPLWTAAGWAQDDRVQVDADALGYEEDGDVVSARGNVVVTKGDARLTADTVRVRRSRNALDARGNVVLADPQGDVRADRLRLELTDETGTIENGTIRLPRRQYTIAGRTLQKLYGQSYRVTDGAVTTCECDRMEDADWSIAADTLDVTVGGTGRLRHGVLRVRDVPLFYVPYGAMAVRTDRHSGLLAPRYGFSNKRGFQWEQPLYWAISKSQDLTVTTDVETSERAGLLGEYRYAPGRSMEGQLWVSYFNEQLRERVSSPAPVHRWSVVGSHRHALTPDVRLYGDLFLVSDDFFLRDMNVAFHPTLERSDRRSKRFTDSRIGGVKTWDHAQLRAEATYYQDLRNNRRRRPPGEDQDAFEFVPRIRFQGRHRLWDDRIDVGLDAEGGHFFRSRGYHGQRLDIAPWISLPFSLAGYGYGAFKATGRETVYRMSSRSPGKRARPGGAPLDRLQTREIVQVEAELGTRLSRVFRVGWGRLRKIQHVLDPHVSFAYVPQVGQDDLPLYDTLDRINRRSLFVYGVTNRLLGKFAPLGEGEAYVRELLQVSVLQAYDTNRRLREESGQRFGLSETGQHFSDVDIRARVLPLPFFSLAADSTVDVDRGDIIAARLDAALRDPRPLPATSPLLASLQRRTSLGISYRTITDRLIKEIDARAVLRVHDALTLAYFTEYDLNSRSFINSRYFFRLFSPQKCWALDFGIVDRSDPDETEFSLSVSLVGFASAGKTAF